MNLYAPIAMTSVGASIERTAHGGEPLLVQKSIASMESEARTASRNRKVRAEITFSPAKLRFRRARVLGSGTAPRLSSAGMASAWRRV